MSAKVCYYVNMTDQYYLKEAIKVGNEVDAPYNFGAVVVKDGVIISREHGHVNEKNDPSLHSEVSAIASACRDLKTTDLSGATIYCSHEPCVMCFSCANWAKIKRVVYVTSKEDQKSFMYEFPKINLGALAKEAHYPIKLEQMSTD
jgi:guanine deaminase